MSHVSSYTINPGWRILLTDVGLRPADVLRRAGLPDDLFGREKTLMTTDEYFRLWQGIEAEAESPLIPLRIGSSISMEAFDPPVFAAMCSPDLNTALGRIARYKRLVMPMALRVDVAPAATTLGLEWLETHLAPPRSLVAAELVFFVQLARIATRTRIQPLEVMSPTLLAPAEAYTEFFGVAPTQGASPMIKFSAADAELPFLTANEKMWEFFEPELRKRLSELDESATMSDRVRGALLELLPSGGALAPAVSSKLAVSVRTLQRWLGKEGQSFQQVLNTTRKELARHYLKTSRLTAAEISFLLGFEDPNSFYRAFHGWTGETPERARNAMLRDN